MRAAELCAIRERSKDPVARWNILIAQDDIRKLLETVINLEQALDAAVLQAERAQADLEKMGSMLRIYCPDLYPSSQP
jgi:hypothetical protein